MMYKPYSDSYLMTKNKKTLIEYLRIAEHNHRVCEETIDQQYKNCMKLLKEERAKTIDEFVNEIKDWQTDIEDNEYDIYKFEFVFERIYEIAEQLKEQKAEVE